MNQPVFDRSTLMESLGGDEDLYREIVALFLKHHANEIENLRRDLTAGDYDKLQRTAHSLKGSVSNFGAERATEAARALEHGLKQGTGASAATALVQEAIAAVNELAGALQQELGR